MELEGAIIKGMRIDGFGSVKLTLEVPQSEAAKAAAIGILVDTEFNVVFTPQENEIIGRKA